MTSTASNSPPLDLNAVEARIERHRCHLNAPRTGEPGFLEISQLIDQDAPALVAEVRRFRGEVQEALADLNAGYIDTAGDILAALMRSVGQAVKP